jgi:elongation factor 1 alpha-like protein
VNWERSRYDEIVGHLQPFLQQTGFSPSKTKFVPVGAMIGVNLLDRNMPDAQFLKEWYDGPTLDDVLGNELNDPSLSHLD